MEVLIKEVSQTREKIHQSRLDLHVTEDQAECSISAEVVAIRVPVAKSEAKIKAIAATTRQLLLMTENDDLTVGLKGIQQGLREIIEELESASSKASDAVETTQAFTYRVMDIDQELKVNVSELQTIEVKADHLDTEARAAVESCQALVDLTMQQIQAKQSEVQRKTSEMASKRSQKAISQAEIAENQAEIARKDDKRDRRIGKAVLGGVLTLAGVALAPVTFGTSTALAVAGGGIAAYQGVRAHELKDEMRGHRQKICELDSEIAECTSSIARLEKEQVELRQRLVRHMDDIVEKRAERTKHERQREEVSEVQIDLQLLQSHADSTASQIFKARGGLGDIKLRIEACSNGIKEQCLAVCMEKTAVTRTMERAARVLHPNGKARHLEKQRLTIKKTSEALQEFSVEVTRVLMPLESASRFLKDLH